MIRNDKAKSKDKVIIMGIGKLILISINNQIEIINKQVTEYDYD